MRTLAFLLLLAMGCDDAQSSPRQEAGALLYIDVHGSLEPDGTYLADDCVELQSDGLYNYGACCPAGWAPVGLAAGGNQIACYR